MRARGFGDLKRLRGYAQLTRREMLDIRHRAANPGGGARRPWRWRGPRWLLYQPGY